MAKRSAGILAYRFSVEGVLEVFLVHPGGPLWENRKDYRCWSIPKGLVEAGESDEEAAVREFCEETGFEFGCDYGSGHPSFQNEIWFLGEFVQSPSKEIALWALECEFDESCFQSNFFELEWPKGSGRFGSYPENDDGRWFEVSEGAERIFDGQRQALDMLMKELDCDVF